MPVQNFTQPFLNTLGFFFNDGPDFIDSNIAFPAILFFWTFKFCKIDVKVIANDLKIISIFAKSYGIYNENVKNKKTHILLKFSIAYGHRPKSNIEVVFVIIHVKKY